MGTMHAFSALVRANLRMHWRDKQAVFWSLAFPIMFMLLLGAAFGNLGNVDLKVAIVDEDHSSESAALDHALRDVDALSVSHPRTREGAVAALEDGKYDIVLVVPAGYGQALANYHPGNATNGTNTTFQPVQLPLFLNGAKLDSAVPASNVVGQVIGGVNQRATNGVQLVSVQQTKVQSRDLKFIDYLAPGIMAMAVMNSGMFGFTLFVVDARSKGILKRLKATPIHPALILGSRVILGLVVSAIQAAIILVVAILLFGLTVVGSAVLLSLVLAVGALTFLSLGFLVSSISRSADSAEALINVIGMPMIFLGDVFIPIDLMPVQVQVVGKLMPLTYFTRGLRTIMIDGGDLAALVPNLGVLAILGIVIFIIAVRTFRWD